MNWIDRIEIKQDVDDTGGVSVLLVTVTPHEGEPQGLCVACRFLTAVEFAERFRQIADAIELWGEQAGITKDNLAAMVASGRLSPAALERTS